MDDSKQSFRLFIKQMFYLSPTQTLLLGLAQIGIGIAMLFLSLQIQVIAWVLILFGSMTIFLAIYLWLNMMITKASEKDQQ